MRVPLALPVALRKSYRSSQNAKIVVALCPWPKNQPWSAELDNVLVVRVESVSFPG